MGGVERVLHWVPVRHKPRQRISIGTVRDEVDTDAKETGVGVDILSLTVPIST